MKDVLFYPSVCLPLVTTAKMPPFCFSNVLRRVIVGKEEHQENTLQLIMVLFGITFDTNGRPQNAHSSMVMMLFRKGIKGKEQSNSLITFRFNAIWSENIKKIFGVSLLEKKQR